MMRYLLQIPKSSPIMYAQMPFFLRHLNDTGMARAVLKFFYFIANKSDGNYIYACNRTKDYYESEAKLIVRESTTIQAPVDIAKLNRNKSSGDYFKSFKGLKVVTVGNVVEVKGHDLFIEMAAGAFKGKKLNSLKLEENVLQI